MIGPSISKPIAKKMKLGVIGESHYHVIGSNPDWNFRSFTFSPDKLSFSRIFNSAFATPARYIEEIFVRLDLLPENGAQQSSRFVFNPLFDVNQLDIMQVVVALQDLPPFDGIVVISDREGFPAGYLFPPAVGTEDARFLTLLSAVDAGLDARLCRLLFQVEVQCVSLPKLSLSRSHTNGFLYGENRAIFLWVAERAVRLLEQNPGTLKDAIPFTAIMPHHAGDALFFASAYKRMRSHINSIAVNKAYCDIVADISPGLDMLVLEGPVINRGIDFKLGTVMPEGAYFETIKSQLPENRFYYYCRPSRDYNVTSLHLMDHTAFAIGRRFYSNDDLVSNRPGLAPFRPLNRGQLRILLHFEGGWPLKTYPTEYQEKLIRLFQAKGHAVTVLGDERGTGGLCEYKPFKTLADFRALLQQCDLLIGVDSFPAHYGVHVYGIPTIGLFGSTRPENSNARVDVNYAFMEKGMRCRPCYGMFQCPLYSKEHCDNYVSPEAVLAEAERMLDAVAAASAGYENRMAQPIAEESCPPEHLDFPAKVKRISLRHLRLKIFLVGAAMPVLRYCILLVQEFSAAVKKDGFFGAILRTFRFLHKKARR